MSDFRVRWFEDESFFSICSRQHCYLGNMSSSATLSWLFGSSNAHTSHDFPCNLAQLNEKAQASWGEPASIISEHTILPFFFPFQTRENITHALQTVRGSSIGSLKYKLGLLTGRFGAEHPLKACIECMNEDRINSGFAYWHLTHQYPGIVLCPKHHLLLRECSKNRQWSGRFQFCLPNDAILSEPRSNECPANVMQKLDSLAQAIIHLAKFGCTTNFNRDIVCRTYRTALVDRRTGGTSDNSIAASFAQHTALLAAHTGMACLPTTASGAAGLLGQLTRQPRGNCHPLKHLILIDWLFGSFDKYLVAYNSLSLQNQFNNELKAALHDVQPCTETKNFQSTPEIKIRRPKILKEPIRLKVLEKLSNGDDKVSISEQFNISRSTIDRLLRSDPNIRDRRIAQRESCKKEFYRSVWIATVASHPSFGVKRVRSYIPHAYMWLYRNDSAWLGLAIANLPSDRRGNYSSIDWLKRDDELFDTIKAMTKYDSPDSVNIKKHDLYFCFPELSKCLEQGRHYPRTKSLVLQLVSRSKKK
ncbi:TnsD family Tn7-like transposition protein [Pseudomonas putida]